MSEVFNKKSSDPTSRPRNRLTTLGTHMVKASCEHQPTPHLGNQTKQHLLHCADSVL